MTKTTPTTEPANKASKTELVTTRTTPGPIEEPATNPETSDSKTRADWGDDVRTGSRPCPSHQFEKGITIC